MPFATSAVGAAKRSGGPRQGAQPAGMEFHGKKPIVIQLDRRKPMAEARRLQKEQETCLKKIQDGLTELEGFKAKAIAAFNAEVKQGSFVLLTRSARFPVTPGLPLPKPVSVQLCLKLCWALSLCSISVYILSVMIEYNFMALRIRAVSYVSHMIEA